MKSFQRFLHTLRSNGAKKYQSTSLPTASFFPSVVRMKGTLTFGNFERYEFQLSGSVRRQRVQLLRMPTEYEDGSLRRSASSSIVAIGPDICTDEQRRRFLERLHALSQPPSCPSAKVDDGESMRSATPARSIWRRMIEEDDGLELLWPFRTTDMSGKGKDAVREDDTILFRIGAPKGIGLTVADLETRYGIDFDAISKEFSRRVNASNLPLLLRVTRFRLPRKPGQVVEKDDVFVGDAAMSCVALTVPVDLIEDARIRQVWSRVRACASEPIKRMKSRIPACRCGE